MGSSKNQRLQANSYTQDADFKGSSFSTASKLHIVFEVLSPGNTRKEMTGCPTFSRLITVHVGH